MNIDEIMSIFWRFVAIAVLVLVNGFFVAAEFALVKIRDTQLRPFIDRGHRRARIARVVLANLDQSLSAAQLGITLASLALGWIGEPLFAKLLQPVVLALKIESETAQHTLSFVVGVTLITYLHVVIGEQAPKWMAIQRPLPTSLWVAWPLQMFGRITYPFIWVLNTSSLWFLRQLGIETSREGDHAHSEEELRLLFATAQKHTDTASAGRDIVLNAFDLRRRVAREVMRPRQQIVGLSMEDSIQQALEIAEHTRFSRFPLLESGNLDKAVGFIHTKDLFAARNKARLVRELQPAAKKLVYIPETARLERLLQLFLERKVHMAFVVDEYGGTVGMVTLENVLEEIVGQIQDEFDQETPLLVKKDENTWSIDGTLPVHDLAEVIGESLAEEGVTTASGWITHRLGGFPKTGDIVRVGRHELRVEQMEGARVARLLLRKAVEPLADH